MVPDELSRTRRLYSDTLRVKCRNVDPAHNFSMTGKLTADKVTTGTVNMKVSFFSRMNQVTESAELKYSCNVLQHKPFQLVFFYNNMSLPCSFSLNRVTLIVTVGLDAHGFV